MALTLVSMSLVLMCKDRTEYNFLNIFIYPSQRTNQKNMPCSKIWIDFQLYMLDCLNGLTVFCSFMYIDLFAIEPSLGNRTL